MVSLKDLFPVKSEDIETLKKICNALESCKAFNTNGWLKKSIDKLYHTQTHLYVKEYLTVITYDFSPLPYLCPEVLITFFC